MGRYLVKRLFASVFSIIILGILTFLLLRLVPGGPFDDDISVSQKVLEKLNESYGYSQPLVVQLFLYLKNILTFDLGRSFLHSGAPVTEVISTYFPRTLQIGGITLIVSVVVSLVMGYIFYFNKNNYVLKLMHFAFLSAPIIFLGPLLIYLFSIKADLFPLVFDGSLKSSILPILILSIHPIAKMSRMLLGSLNEAMKQPWVITTRSFGFKESKIVFYFAIKQSLIPLLTYLGPATAGLLSGSILVESMFNIQGLGLQYIEGIINRDYFLVTGLTVWYGVILIFSSFLFEIIMVLVDPRIIDFKMTGEKT